MCSVCVYVCVCVGVRGHNGVTVGFVWSFWRVGGVEVKLMLMQFKMRSICVRTNVWRYERGKF